ncbi:MAG: RagB/SusD family nutrient uptake outer membrane protein [Bacteroides sp.]|nr:RagB/SusD family nutrient uptake outer membrane protein [Bacteroides sp.]
MLTACNDFLDEMPDNRTEIDTPEKITKLLISAYSQNLPILVHEQMSDNVTDRGIAYTWDDENCRDAYLFNHTFSTIDTDSPHDLWEQNYKAVAAANLALESIEKLEAADSSLDLSAQKGEALICRAYAHFTLCNIFCQPYNPQSSTTDLGVPYVTKVETTAENQYERGTVAQVYEKIAADIEEGLPLIDDNLYKQPKYHFTRTATNAFAAQFYLFYGKYQEAVTHATAAIGENPSSIMRDYSSWKGLTGGDEYTSAWVDSKVQANLLLQGIHSMSGRMAYDSRAVHTYELLVETTDSRGPTWGAGSLIFSKYIRFYGSTSGIPSYIFPKQMEYFVFTNEAENIGYAYILNVAYSVEKTLLNRAEAYTLLEQYDKAATDLSYFYVASNARAADVATITGFYETAGSLYKKPMAPRFTVNAGTQENMIHACLHARRILTLHEGTRLLDLKRYGIAYTHVNLNGTDINIEPYDKRLALQIPGLVISAGMQPNPR